MRRRILIVGLPYFGRLLERSLGERGWDARYCPHPGRNPRDWFRLATTLPRAHLVYFIGSRIDKGSLQAMFARVWRRPMVIHWVGTDVVFALEAYRADQASKRLLRRAVHLADAPWLSDELREIGVQATYMALPVTTLHTGEPEPLPETFRVLFYYPVDAIDREVFDLDAMYRLAREFPAIEFHLIPSPPRTLPKPLPENLTASGWTNDMESVYRETTVHIRITAHDGTSFMALEALSRGRYVIWTFPVQGAILARGFERIAAALRDLVDAHKQGELGLNADGRAAVLREFDPMQLAENLDARLREIVDRGPPARTESQARQ